MHALVMRRQDVLWAVDRDAVQGLEPAAAGLTVRLRQCHLAVDEVVGLAIDLATRRPGSVLRHLWPRGCVAMALHGGAPVIVVDPANPPEVLWRQGAQPDEQPSS